jgi:hypothetical protein
MHGQQNIKFCTINCVVIVLGACCGQLRVKVETRSVSLNRKLPAFTNEFLFSPMSRDLLEKLIMPSSDQEIPPAFEETGRFVAACTSSRNVPLSIQFMPFLLFLKDPFSTCRISCPLSVTGFVPEDQSKFEVS